MPHSPTTHAYARKPHAHPPHSPTTHAYARLPHSPTTHAYARLPHSPTTHAYARTLTGHDQRSANSHPRTASEPVCALGGKSR